MCSHFETLQSAKILRDHFKVRVDSELDGLNADIWPGSPSILIRLNNQGERVLTQGVFGLIPHWAKDRKITRFTYNARSETVHTKPAFKSAWANQQHCLVPAQAIYEPDWRSGRAVAARVSLCNGEPMALAGIWSSWRDAAGNSIMSFSLLTINAEQHPLMKYFHRPLDEKRMVVILPPQQQQVWLTASTEERMNLLVGFDASQLKSVSTSPKAERQSRLFD